MIFIWIPSHYGIQSNEIVDQLAKRAIHEGLDTNFKAPYSDLFHISKKCLNADFKSFIKRTSRNNLLF